MSLFGKVKSSASPEHSSEQRGWILLVLWSSVHVWKCFSSSRGARPALQGAFLPHLGETGEAQSFS